MAITSLKTQMDAIVMRTEERILAVTKQAIYDTVEQAQEVRPTGKMPFDTGFLRHSGTSSLNTPPTGPIRGEKAGKYKWSDDTLLSILARMKIGDVFYFGWTAVYARKQEARHGFLESAVMNWQSHVDKAVAVFRKKDGK